MTTRLASFSQEAMSSVRSLWLATEHRSGFEAFGGVFTDVSIAEVDRRHVASKLRRIAGSIRGLASVSRELVSEAGLSVT